MKCKCIEEMQKILADHYKEKAGPDCNATIKGTAINFESGTTVLGADVIVRGANKPFNTKKGQIVYFRFSFCPFCGKETK